MDYSRTCQVCPSAWPKIFLNLSKQYQHQAAFKVGRKPCWHTENLDLEAVIILFIGVTRISHLNFLL